MRHIYFIVNPKARNGYCLNIWKNIETKLSAEQLTYLAVFTDYPGHAKLIASQIAAQTHEPAIIIAVGGDGTMHEVMNGIIGAPHITLGFIPGGSGNDFSRGFQIPADAEQALTVLLRLMKREPLLIDVGKVSQSEGEENYFINNMGAGFDAAISYEVNHSRIKGLLNKLSMGRLVYVIFLIKKLFTYKTSTIDLSIDRKKHIFEKTWFVTVSNQPYYGGGMKIAPDAEPDDGLLDITVVHQLSRLKLLFVFISVFWGKHIYFKEVKTFKGRVVTIQSQHPLYVHADGEHIGYTPLSIQIQAKQVGVLTRISRKEVVEQKERDSNDFC